MDSNIYQFINKLNKEVLFLYSFIFIVVLAIFSRVNITLGIILGLVVFLFIILYIDGKSETSLQNEKVQYDKKLENIKPKPKKITNEYKDFIDYFFSIQDFYPYNQQAYENAIDGTDNFIQLYEDIQVNPNLSNQLFETMYDKKRDILNNIHSIILKLPGQKIIVEKHSNSLKTMDELLTKYLNKVKYLHDKDLYENGYNINYKPINNGPLAFNKYNTNSNSRTSYEFY